MQVNSYVMASSEDPRIAAAKPIMVERKIPRTIKPPKPAQDHPFKASIVAQEAHDSAPRVTRPLPSHLQSTAPKMADCVVTHLLSPARRERLEFDAAEMRAVQLLAAAGLVPTLRHREAC